jgi:hypothetical protein
LGSSINLNDLDSNLHSIKSKRILKFVITNYPTFSGYIIEGVHVIDFLLLFNYISSGTYTKAALPLLKKGLYEEDIITESIQYQNENDFCNNLFSNLTNPQVINELKSTIEIQMNKISHDGNPIDFYVQVAEFS